MLNVIFVLKTVKNFGKVGRFFTRMKFSQLMGFLWVVVILCCLQQHVRAEIDEQHSSVADHGQPNVPNTAINSTTKSLQDFLDRLKKDKPFLPILNRPDVQPIPPALLNNTLARLLQLGKNNGTMPSNLNLTELLAGFGNRTGRGYGGGGWGWGGGGGWGGSGTGKKIKYP